MFIDPQTRFIMFYKLLIYDRHQLIDTNSPLFIFLQKKIFYVVYFFEI
jgi:hypothetical protein